MPLFPPPTPDLPPTQDEPLREMPPVVAGTGSPQTDAYIARSLALIESDTKKPDDIVTREQKKAMEIANSRDPRGIVERDIDARLVRDAPKRAEALAREAQAKGELPPINELAGQFQSLINRNNQPWMLEVIRQESLKKSPEKFFAPFFQFEKASEADRYTIFQSFTASYAQEAVGRYDGWDKAADWFGAIFLTPTSGAMAGLAGDAPIEPLWWTKTYLPLLRSYHTLGLEQRMLAFPDIVKEIDGRTNNHLILQAMLAPFMGLESEVNWMTVDLATDAITGVGAIIRLMNATKMARALKLGNSYRKMLVDAGRYEDAADMVAAALKNDDMKKALGLPSEVTAMELLPFNFKELTADVLGGLSEKMWKTLNTDMLMVNAHIKSAFARLTNEDFLPDRRFFDESKKLEYQSKVLDGVRMPNTAEIISQDKDGFNLRVVYPPKTGRAVTDIEGDITVLDQTAKEITDEIKLGAETLEAEDLAALEKELDTLQTSRTSLEKELFEANEALDAPTEEIIRYDYTREQFGSLDTIQSRQGLEYLSSPEVLMSEISKGAAETATRLGMDSEKVRATLGSVARDIVKGLNRRELANVNTVLRHGNDTEAVFTPYELARGVVTPEGIVQMNGKEIRAYMNTRNMYDELHSLKERLVHREMVLDNWKHSHLVGLKGPDGSTPQVYLRWDDGTATIPDGMLKVYDQGARGIIDVAASRVAIEKRLASGQWRMIPVKESYEHNGEFFTHILAKENGVSKQLTPNVLNKAKGYVPVSRPKVHWIVKQRIPAVVNGVKSERIVTARFFDSEMEAKTWAKLQKDPDTFLEPRRSRETSDAAYRGYDDEFDNTAYGGMFGSPRSDRKILMGMSGTEAYRVPAIQAMQQYIDHVSYRLPMNEFRQAMEQRFMNSAREFLADKGNWQSDIVGLSKDSIEYRNLKIAQDYLRSLRRIPTAQERVWADVATRVARSMEPAAMRKPGGFVDAVRRTAINMSTKDPFSFMHTFAFHSTLGTFNLRQLIVQSMGAVNAFAMDPLRAPKYINQYGALRGFMFAENEAAVKSIGALYGLDPKDAVRLWKEYRKSGLGYSIHNSADWSAQMVEQSKFMAGFRKILDAGTIPVKEGEHIARGYSWLMVRDRYLRKNPRAAKRELTQKEIDEITDQSLAYTFNMTRTNAAEWQKGAWKPMTQFWQINAKVLEAWLPHWSGMSNLKLTPAERARMILAQGILFGAAGAGDWAERLYAEAEQAYVAYYNAGVTNPEDKRSYVDIFGEDTATIKKYIQGGVVEGFLYQGDLNIKVTDRLGFGAGVEEAMNQLKDMDASALEMLMGVSFPLPAKYVMGLQTTLRILGAGRPLEKMDEEELIQVFRAWAPVLSSMNNATKGALIYHWGAVKDSSGRLVQTYTVNDSPFAYAMAQLVGFEPYVLEEARQARNFTKWSEADKRERVDALVKMSQLLTNNKSPEWYENPENQDFLGAMHDAMMADIPLEGDGARLRHELNEMFLKRMNEKEDGILKMMERANEEMGLRAGDTTGGDGNISFNVTTMPSSPESKTAAEGRKKFVEGNGE